MQDHPVRQRQADDGGGAAHGGERRESKLPEPLEFMRLLWAVDHALQSTSKRMEQDVGMTGPQRLVIRLVGRFPRISAGELAELLEIHPSTLTGILRRLETRGAIERAPDPADGRRALFQLTRAGSDLDCVTDGTVEAAMTRALERLTAHDLASARTVLDALRDCLEQQARERTPGRG